MGTARKAAPRSFVRSATGLEMLCGLVGRLSLSNDLDWASVLGPELLRWCVQELAIGSVVDGLFLPSMDTGEPVMTRWEVSKSGTAWPGLTAVVSIVMVGLASSC